MYWFKNSHCHENRQRDRRHPAGIWWFRQYPPSVVSLWVYQPILLPFMPPHSCRCSDQVSCLTCNTNLLLFAVITIFLTHCLRYGLGRCDRIVSILFFPLSFELVSFSKCFCLSEVTPEGRRITKLDQILLNGNNITMVGETIFWLLLPLRSPNISLLFCSSSREEKVLKYEGGCNLRSAL